MKTVEETRNQAAIALSPRVKEELEQFLTPMPVALQAASLFTLSKNPVKILDLGAGTGILSALVMKNSPTESSILAIEKDHHLAKICEKSLNNVSSHVTVLNDSLENIQFTEHFERVILNPPYKKITPINVPTQYGPVKVTNLYTYFLVRAADALTDRGECVAIIPRSWMNGDYFKDFRSWLTMHYSIDTLAIYNSRTDHFKDMNVLQEIMLIKITKANQKPKIVVYPRLPQCG